VIVVWGLLQWQGDCGLGGDYNGRVVVDWGVITRAAMGVTFSQDVWLVGCQLVVSVTHTGTDRLYRPQIAQRRLDLQNQ